MRDIAEVFDRAHDLLSNSQEWADDHECPTTAFAISDHKGRRGLVFVGSDTALNNILIVLEESATGPMEFHRADS